MSEETKLEWFMVQSQKLYIGRERQHQDIRGIIENKGEEHGPKGQEDTQGQRWWGTILLPSNVWYGNGELPTFTDCRNDLEEQLQT